MTEKFVVVAIGFLSVEDRPKLLFALFLDGIQFASVLLIQICFSSTLYEYWKVEETAPKLAYLPIFFYSFTFHLCGKKKKNAS